MSTTLGNQLEAVIQDWNNAAAKSRHGDASDILKEADVRDLETRCLAAIQRVSGESSFYAKRAAAVLSTKNHIWGHLRELIGVARGLLSDLRNDYLQSFEEMIHAEVFADYLDMAEHLLSSGYKDAAAVVAGSTLEAHLRKLCGRNSLSIAKPDGTPQKADLLNADLAKSQVYGKTDQKSVTSWLGLRNDAAHGHYGNYDQQQVKLMLEGIRNFISRVPA